MNEEDVKAIKEFDEKLKLLMEEYNVKIDIAIDFPQYKIQPEEVKYALYLFKKHGGVLIPTYKRKENKV